MAGIDKKIEQQIHNFSVEMYWRGYSDRTFEENTYYIKEARDEAYQKGLDDAWKCVRDIVGLGKPLDIVEGAGFDNFVCKYSASVAIEKVKEYVEDKEAEEKLEEKSELRVGDEVIVGNDEFGYLKPKFIVTGIDNQDAYLLNRSNGLFTTAFLEGCHKTGKHYSEIKAVLLKE